MPRFGSMIAGSPKRLRLSALRIAFGERQAEIAEVALLALEDVLGDAAGERHRLGARTRPAAGRSASASRPGPPAACAGPGRRGRRSRPARSAARRPASSGSPSVSVMPSASATVRAGSSMRVRRPSPSRAIRRAPIATAAVAMTWPSTDQRQLGGAAADVDVEQRALVAAGARDRAGAVGGQHGLHVVAGRRARRTGRPPARTGWRWCGR